MMSAFRHYRDFLAPHYLWMAGGLDHACALGAQDLAPFLGRPGDAIDLGAGFGMHAIPLAKAGFSVLAVDSSQHLVQSLRSHSQGLDITAVEGDLLDFAQHLDRPVELIICMGDTLTHVSHIDQVELLIRRIARSLNHGGRFVATFRDYLEFPVGDRRYILVKSSPSLIHTCGIEQRQDTVLVHDIIHESLDQTWTLRTSSYEKMRLSPHTVAQFAESAGMMCRVQPGPRGMVQVVAENPELSC